MPLYRNTTKTKLILDVVPGQRRLYECRGAGSTTPRGVANDFVDIAAEHLTLPGISAAIKNEVLVPFAGLKPEEVKAAEAPVVATVVETPVPDLSKGISGGEPTPVPAVAKAEEVKTEVVVDESKAEDKPAEKVEAPAAANSKGNKGSKKNR